MCGIAGKLKFDPEHQVERAEIEAMLAPILHRGPDSQGIHLDACVGLGHARLSIIDLAAGLQPMSNEDETVWIVFNGEIYNYLDLREQLLARGHRFKTHSDTEVILHAYEEYGPDCVKHLRGMFGFALWDANRRRLFVARDRVGIKPVYYCQTGDGFYFGSELKSIIADSGVSREVDLSAIRQFLDFYYVPGQATLFRSIRKLLPGHYLLVEQGRVNIQQYWDLTFNQDRFGNSFESVVEELHELLASTVRDHMIADVPVGVLLSGGVDSTAVLNFAVQGTAKKVKTFTVGFDGNQVVDERPFARLAAQRFGTEHFEISITSEDFWNFLPSYVWHMEEPVCEPPAVALYYVSKLARHHVKVLLSGEGGDEAFGGYANYPAMLKLERIQNALGPLAGPVGTAAGAVFGLLGHERLRRYGAALGRPLSDHYFSRNSGSTSFFHTRAARFLTPAFQLATDPTAAAQSMARLLQPVRDAALLNQMLYADTKTWLPDDLLVKADKMTMANSVELRVPLLDHRVLEFAASLPPHYKVAGNQTKRALKAAFAKVLPQEILTRKKAGFPVPYNSWLRSELTNRVRDVLLSDRARNRGYFQPREVERLLDSQQRDGRLPKEVFSLLVLELWHRQFVDGPQPSIDHNAVSLAPEAASATRPL